jgi:catechol 2,3-dioxygenase
MQRSATEMATEPLHDIAHLGSVELLTAEPDRSLWYFRDVLGMTPVHRSDRSVYLRGWGDYAASTLKLTTSDAPGVGRVAWRTTSAAALERRAAALEAAGLGIGWNNGDYGRGRSYRFHDPDGHTLEIYYEEQRYEAPPTERSVLKNQPQKYSGRGVGVRRIDHLVLLASDVPANRRFATDLLGFQVREQVIFDQGKREIGSWMSPTAIHHQLAYVVDVRRGRGRLHHFSLWVDNREDVLRAADILTENGIFIEAGPAKHNNGQGFYLYSYEPGGNRVEIYTGSYLVLAPDWKPVVWSEAERASGNHWGGALPQSFLQYGTPDIESGDPPAETPKLPVFF